MSSGSGRPTGVTWDPLEFLGQLVDVRRVPRERETGAHMQMSTLCFFLILKKMFIDCMGTWLLHGRAVSQHLRAALHHVGSFVAAPGLSLSS